MKAKNIFGVPIHKMPNFDCKYFHDFSRDGKFDECTCPMAKIYMQKHNYSTILKCSDDYKKCLIYKDQNEQDIKFVEKYIKEHVDGRWIYIDRKTADIIVKEKISINSENYLVLLFNYFGYNIIKDERFMDGVIFNNLKINAL